MIPLSAEVLAGSGEPPMSLKIAAASEVQPVKGSKAGQKRAAGQRRGEVNTSGCSGVLSSGTLQTKTTTRTDVSGAATCA